MNSLRPDLAGWLVISTHEALNEFFTQAAFDTNREKPLNVLLDFTADEHVNIDATGIPNLNIATVGETELTTGSEASVTALDRSLVHAFGNSKISTFDRAKAIAHDEVIVSAFDASQVDAFDRSHVKATNQAFVRLHNESSTITDEAVRFEAADSSVVLASGFGHGRLSDSARAHVMGSIEVGAYGEAKIDAFGNVRLFAHENTSWTVKGNAVVRADGQSRGQAYGQAQVWLTEQASVLHRSLGVQTGYVSLGGDATSAIVDGGTQVVTASGASPSQVRQVPAFIPGTLVWQGHAGVAPASGVAL